MSTARLQVPNVTQADFSAFHELHFSTGALKSFQADFLDGQQDAPQEEDEEWEEADDDDGLGYYEDGVKRTLTDEQVAIFRHSEIQALKKARQKRADGAAEGLELKDEDAEDGEVEDGSILNDSLVGSEITPQQPGENAAKKKKKRGKGKQKGSSGGRNGGGGGEKIDLRKRTWDVVGKGLESLDYGEEQGDAQAAAHGAQRRRISYDDE